MKRSPVGFYLYGKASTLGRYALGEGLQGLIGWIPSVLGIGLRAVVYKAILHSEGLPAVEDHVRLCRPEDIWLGRGVYIDHGAYLHGGPGGLRIGAGSWIMNGSRLHVFNFRNLPHSGIHIGSRTFVGEGSIMRGQGGIVVGDNVLFGPGTRILAVNHVFVQPDVPIMNQGITAEGIRIEDNCWIGAGATVLDGITIGRGSCVGAGAVVTKSIPPHSLAVGVPARVIRNLVSDPLPQPTAAIFRGGMDDLRD
jgi:carbonic anhydrase/acetyltransferase-like protein (isoleucine patch superfamily)